jgi:hypothetical protein
LLKRRFAMDVFMNVELQISTRVLPEFGFISLKG